MTNTIPDPNPAREVGAGHRPGAGFTMVELLIAMTVMTVVSLVAFSFLRSGAILTAKTTRLNHSHDELRVSFDRLGDHLLAANNVPTLIAPNGNPAVVSTTIGPNGFPMSGPAAGLKFSKLVGDPYVLDPPSTPGSFTNTTTTLSVWRSVNSVSTAPLPSVGDVMLIPTPGGVAEGHISVVAPQPATPAMQKITLTFSSPLGKALSWQANQPQVAKIVRTEAFIVLPNNDPRNPRNELRFYPQFDQSTMSSRSQYKVLTVQIGMAAGEDTPFWIVDMNGDRVAQSTLRVRETDSRYVSTQERNTYSGYFQLLLNMPSRLRPKTTNP